MTLLTISYIEIYKNIFLSESYQEKVYTLWEKNKKKKTTPKSQPSFSSSKDNYIINLFFFLFTLVAKKHRAKFISY